MIDDSAPKWAGREFIYVMGLELQMRHLVKLGTHEVGVDTSEHSNMAYYQHAPPLSLYLHDDGANALDNV